MLDDASHRNIHRDRRRFFRPRRADDLAALEHREESPPLAAALLVEPARAPLGVDEDAHERAGGARTEGAAEVGRVEWDEEMCGCEGEGRRGEGDDEGSGAGGEEREERRMEGRRHGRVALDERGAPVRGVGGDEAAKS